VHARNLFPCLLLHGSELTSKQLVGHGLTVASELLGGGEIAFKSCPAPADVSLLQHTLLARGDGIIVLLDAAERARCSQHPGCDMCVCALPQLVGSLVRQFLVCLQHGEEATPDLPLRRKPRGVRAQGYGGLLVKRIRPQLAIQLLHV